MFNIPPMEQSEKTKTLPGNTYEKKVGCVLRTQECLTKPKDSMIKSVKTLKEEIFESLNRKDQFNTDDNIQLKSGLASQPHQLNKNSSYAQLNQQSRN